jgi:hypothetical protein
MARANERASHFMFDHDKNPKNSDPSFGHEEGLNAISTETSTVSVLSFLVEGQNAQNPVFLPMLIDLKNDGSLNHQPQGNFSNIHLEASILLRNLGLSTLYRACVTLEPSHKESLFQKSYHLFKLSRSLLDRIRDEEETSVELCETLLLMDLLLEYEQLYTSVQLGLGSHAIIHHERFQLISSWITQRERFINNGLIAASAA